MVLRDAALPEAKGCLGMAPLPPSSLGAPLRTGIKLHGRIALDLSPIVLVDRPTRWSGPPSGGQNLKDGWMYLQLALRLCDADAVKPQW